MLDQHLALAEWLPEPSDYTVMAIGGGLAVAAAAGQKWARGRKVVKDLWAAHFEEFLDHPCQPVVGTRGGVSSYCRAASHRAGVPTLRAALHAMRSRFVERRAPTISLNRDANFMLYGGSEPSALAEAILRKRSARFGFGLVDGASVHGNPSEAQRAAVIAQRRGAHTQGDWDKDRAHGEWVVVDRDEQRTLVRPLLRSQSRVYSVDGAIIMKVSSPAKQGRSILAFMGAREVGTYLASAFVSSPLFVPELRNALKQEGVLREDFQAVVRFALRPYQFARLPSRRTIAEAHVVSVHNLG